MTEALTHHGPDGGAAQFFPEHGAGLASRRLEIVDLVTGSQPIANEDGSVLLVCNGEICNHRELRAVLESGGHRFRTQTDVETALHLYKDLGEGCLDTLNGMFGMGVLDLRQGRLLPARDRAGMKPLCTASTAHGFLFASEPRTLLCSGLVEPAPDWAGIDTYLAAGPLRKFLFDLLLDPGALGGSLDRKALEGWLRRWLDRPDAYLRRPWSLAILAGWWNSCMRR